MKRMDREAWSALKWYPVFLLICALVLLAVNTGRGQTLPARVYVSSTTGSNIDGDGTIDNPYATISYAIEVAPAAGDTIIVLPGRYDTADDDTLRIDFSKPLNIRSEGGPEVTTVVGGFIYLGPWFDFRTLLQGLRIVNGLPAVRVDSASVEIVDCIIDSCSAGGLQNGGGINLSFSVASIRNCTIQNCQAAGAGGGICCYFSPVDIIDCRIMNNSSSQTGGGIYCFDPLAVKQADHTNIANCVIIGNSGGDVGGIYLYLGGRDCMVVNNLIGDNIGVVIGGEGVGGIYLSYGILGQVYNNIFYRNTGVGIYGSDYPPNVFTGHNCFYLNTGLWQVGIANDTGGHVFDAPQFVDYEGGDYHLLRTSPLVDAGLTDIALPVSTDFDGQDRIAYGGIDIGPDEFADCEIVADFTADTLFGCNQLTVTFQALVTGMYQNLIWEFGDGSFGYDAPLITHTYTAIDTYTAVLQAVSPCTTVVDTLEEPIRVIGQPIAKFGADVTYGCAPLTVNFTDSSLGDVIEWAWQFGDGDTSSAASPTHVYELEGEFTVTLTVSNGCGISVLQKIKYVVAMGQAHVDFAAEPMYGSAPLEVSFTDSSANNPSAWSWDFGDGSPLSNEQNPVHTYVEPGLYTVTLESTNECGPGYLVREEYIRAHGFDLVITDSVHEKAVKHYYFDVDTLYGLFDRDITLKADLHGTPRRGKVTFVFDDSVVNVGSSSRLRALLSTDLARGTYTGEITATAVGGSPLDVDTFEFESLSDSLIQVSTDSLMFDTTEIGSTTAIPVTVRNLSALPGDLYELRVDSMIMSGDQGFSVTPSSFVLQPNSSRDILVSFTPLDISDYSAVMTIYSDDPAYPELNLYLSGIGIVERVPPRITETAPGQWESDVLISISNIDMWVSEPIDTLLVTPNAVMVTSRRTGTVVPGETTYLMDSLMIRFSPDSILVPLDTVVVTVSGDLVDTVGNSLDGNDDGVGEGSPVDDFVLRFLTGPGVFPGDANNDGVVNEVDVLPLGVFWRNQGPARPDTQLTGWRMQAAYAWEDLGATYADCNGDGKVGEGDLSVIEANWGLTHDPLGSDVKFNNSDLERFSGAFEAIVFAIADDPESEITVSIRDLVSNYINLGAQPDGFSLSQNYPNPFNPTTYIQYNLPTESHVVLTIHNILGQTVAVLVDQLQDAGFRQVAWNGESDAGERLPSGIYFYRLTAGGFSQVKKMMMLR